MDQFDNGDNQFQKREQTSVQLEQEQEVKNDQELGTKDTISSMKDSSLQQQQKKELSPQNIEEEDKSQREVINLTEQVNELKNQIKKLHSEKDESKKAHENQCLEFLNEIHALKIQSEFQKQRQDVELKKLEGQISIFQTEIQALKDEYSRQSKQVLSCQEEIIKNIVELPRTCHDVVMNSLQSLIDNHDGEDFFKDIFVNLRDLIENTVSTYSITLDNETFKQYTGGIISIAPENSVYNKALQDAHIELVLMFENHCKFINQQIGDVLITFGPWLRHDKEDILGIWRQNILDWQNYKQNESKKISDISKKVIELLKKQQQFITKVLQKVKISVHEQNKIRNDLIDMLAQKYVKNQI